MTIIISPAKKLTPTNNSLGVETTRSEFPDKLNELIDYAKSLSEKDLIDKMKISSTLASLTLIGFKNFKIDQAQMQQHKQFTLLKEILMLA